MRLTNFLPLLLALTLVSPTALAAPKGKKAGWSDERVEFVKAKIMGLKVTYDEKPAEE